MIKAAHSSLSSLNLKQRSLTMKSKVVNFGILFFMAAVVLVCASRANTQTARRSSEAAIQVGTVNERSPAVDLKTVGKLVAPGVLEVDPNSVRGKRITISGGADAARRLCIGKWDGVGCKGIYLEWGKD
jgi:hypothetical protein